MAFIGNTVQTQGFTPAIDYFSGNASTVTFTLSRPVVSVSQMIVSVANVIQNPSSAYTVSGNSITFSSAPPSGTNNIWVEYTSLITTYAAISQSPSVIGDITTSGGFFAQGTFGNTYIDGTVVDYVTGMGRITAGPADGITLYNGGTSARTALTTWTSGGNVGIGTTSPSGPLSVVYSTNGVYNTGLAISNNNSGSAAGAALQLNNDAGNRGGAWLTSSTCSYYGGTNSFNVGTVDSIPMTLMTGNSPRLTVSTSGNLTFNTSNAGIIFNNSSALTNSTLNDYETGTWTPNIVNSGSSSTWGSKVGYYVKVGLVVHCWFLCDGGNSGTAGTQLTLQGLPFSLNSSNANYGTTGVIATNDSSNYTGTVGQANSGTTVNVNKGGQSWTVQQTYISGQFSYRASF